MASTVILITGANSGVGFATAKVLASASDTFHVIMASRSHEKVKAAMSEIEAAGLKGALSIMRLDVTNEKSVEEAAAHVKEEFGRLDVLVNNAGMGNIRLTRGSPLSYFRQSPLATLRHPPSKHHA